MILGQIGSQDFIMDFNLDIIFTQVMIDFNGFVRSIPEENEIWIQILNFESQQGRHMILGQVGSQEFIMDFNLNIIFT